MLIEIFRRLLPILAVATGFCAIALTYQEARRQADCRQWYELATMYRPQTPRPSETAGERQPPRPAKIAVESAKGATPPTPTQQATAPEFFIASKKTKTFHRPECPSAERIVEENKRTFDSAEQAFKAGYKPCRKCQPAKSTSAP